MAADVPGVHTAGGGFSAISAHNEMADPPDERQQWPLLHDLLELCERTGNKVYRVADAEAQQYQRHHKIITALAAVFGTTAVLLAIVQLSSFVRERGLLPTSGEFVAALIALFAMILGLVASFQRRYLLERHKAERYRLLKFGFLIDPDLYTGNEAETRRRTDRLSQEVVDVAALTHHTLDVWVMQDDVSRMPGDTQTPHNTLSSLVEYYLVKRLNQQITYFSQAAKPTSWERFTRHLPALFFFVSVLLAFDHFALAIYERGAGHGQQPHEFSGHGRVSELLIVLAACFPVLGAGIRTLHTASEQRRNAIRFQAICYALEKLREVFQQERDAAMIFRLLWQCERIREVEHREWLRLMIEAEWFG